MQIHTVDSIDPLVYNLVFVIEIVIHASDAATRSVDFPNGGHMQLYRLVLTVLSILLLSASVLGQQPVTETATAVTPPDARATQAIQAALAAMGATAAPTPALMTLSQGIVTYPDGSTAPIRIETIGNNLVRHDIGQNFTFVSNAGNGFLILKGNRQPLSSWSTAYERVEHIPSLTLMSDYQNPNFQASYVGLESVNGNPAIHLRLSVLATDDTPADLQDMMSESHVWIDPVSMLVVKTRLFDFSPQAIQNRTPVDSYFSDYRQQDGVLVPFHVVRFFGADKQLEMTFTAISLIAKISVTDFQ